MRLSLAAIKILATAAFCFSAPGQTTPAKEAPSNNEAKGIPPRASPADYPSQSHAGNVTIAAEFAGHSIPKPEGPLSTEDYIVVETALFGATGDHLTLSINDFSLRVNGKKAVLSSQPSEYVARSVKDPEWVPPDQPSAPKSKGGLSTGGQGDNGPPPPVHVPIELRRAMAQYVQRASLPQGDRPLPQAGLLFFESRSQTKNIHSLELVYSGPAGKATLNLQP